jgi:hypothetical protein
MKQELIINMALDITKESRIVVEEIAKQKEDDK